MPSSKQAVTLILPLLIMSIFSSYMSVAFALDVFYSNPVCHVTSQTQTQTNQTCCYTQTTTDNNGKTVSQDYCYDCIKTTTMKDFACGTRYPTRTSTGSANPLPPSAGAAQSSSTPPPSNFIPPPSTSPLPSRQQTTAICPNGLTPDANGNCPPTTTTTQNPQSPSIGSNNLGGSASNNNNPSPPDHHHHKGNDLGQLGSSAKKGRNNNNDNSPTHPACPDKGPIPPNCTLKPTF